jgi:Flp pilus assembly protein TadG
MMLQGVRGSRRRGAVAAETALVMLLMVTMVFGIFEYCRLLMDWNLLNNAAREGCRYAQVNNTSPTISTDVQTVVNNYLGLEANSFSGLTVTVSGSHLGVATSVNNLAAGDIIIVTVSGSYKFMNIFPVILPTSLVLTSAVTMGCEGGT